MPDIAANAVPCPRHARLWRPLAVLTLLVAIWATYANSTSGPFVFDDFAAITENPSLRRFSTAFSPPADRGLPVTGRPLVNVSFAVNYAVGGLDPRGYHVGNILLHAATALAVFGLVRRTLGRPPLGDRFGSAALPVAWFAALLWALHPLSTAAVDYVSQRAEVLVALFYVSTLYAVTRSLDSQRSQGWLAVAAIACWLGMATKEVMVSAPIVVFLYDRTFGAGTIAGAWRARRWFHVLLTGSWILLAWLMAQTGGRAGTAGLGLGVTPWSYAVKQCEALAHYLRLALWPSPLAFDYGGMQLIENPWSVAPQALIVLGLAGATIWALRHRPVVGFVGASCFAILAPTSSFVPVADPVFEHRMYLPLAFLVALVIGAGFRLCGRWMVIGLLAGLPAALMTAQRNANYRSEIALWADTVAKRPENVRARYTLGTALAAAGRDREAITQFQAALRLDARSAAAHNGLANLLARHGEWSDAIEHYEAALSLNPSAQAHNNLANVLLQAGHTAVAREHYAAALRLRPDFADAHNNLGNLLARAGELPAAAEHYEAALRLRPDLADAHANLANVLAQTGRVAEAITHYETALQLRPDFADAHFNLATTLTGLRRWSEAIAHYEAVQRLRPQYPGLADALARARMGRELFGR